jgi:hypothetical protein
VRARLIDDGPVGRSDLYLVEISVSPDSLVSWLRESVVLQSNLASKPRALLEISTMVLKPIRLDPDSLVFRLDGENPLRGDRQRKVIINSQRRRPSLQLIEVQDPDNYLSLEVKPIVAGRRFELIVVLKEEKIPEAGESHGRIVILTDDPDSRQVDVEYAILVR